MSPQCRPQLRKNAAFDIIFAIKNDYSRGKQAMNATEFPLPREAALLSETFDQATVDATMSFWHSVHGLINSNQPPKEVIEQILKIIGIGMGADRTYTFSLTSNRTFSICTHEWLRQPDYAITPRIYNIDQRGLLGWLHHFDLNPSVNIEDVSNPPDDLRLPADRFKRDNIKSIYVFGFFDNGHLLGYLGVDYLTRTTKLCNAAHEMLSHVASILNLFLLRHDMLELWNQTAKSLPSALFIKDVDNDLRYIYANPRYLQFYGQNIIGKSDVDIFGEKYGKLFREQDEECLRTGQAFHADGPQHDFSEKAIGYFSVTKYPIATPMGHRYIVGIIADITSEHEMRVQTTDLLEKTKVAEKSKSLFLAAMSHEIRTPLNAIIGFIDELRHTDIPEADRAEYLASAASASRSLLALINDVLDISKIDSGQMHMTPVETDLLVLLAECESIFSEQCHRRGISYICEVSPELPVLILDTSRLRQILFNLVGNAVKFTKTGGVYVYGKFERGNAETGTFTLEVTDTGIGISEEDQKVVFGMFQQASRIRGSNAAGKGSGLGLCLCKLLAENMNGDISLTSTLGKGSTFRVVLHDLPYIERSKCSDVIRHRKDQTIRINSVFLEACVLVVDDVPMNLKVLGIILKRMNISAVLAKSAKEGLDILAKGGITHVLTDVWMPEMNGEEFARAIRANPAWSHIRIAAQTADVEAADNFDAKLFDAILSKPLTPEKVFAFLTARGNRRRAD